jgi:hypothetical protein
MIYTVSNTSSFENFAVIFYYFFKSNNFFGGPESYTATSPPPPYKILGGGARPTSYAPDLACTHDQAFLDLRNRHVASYKLLRSSSPCRKAVLTSIWLIPITNICYS